LKGQVPRLIAYVGYTVSIIPFSTARIQNSSIGKIFSEYIAKLVSYRRIISLIQKISTRSYRLLGVTRNTAASSEIYVSLGRKIKAMLLFSLAK
jgi:hypothetical protein